MIQYGMDKWDLRKQENKVILIFFISLLFYLVFILYGDLQKIRDLAYVFNWRLIPFLLLLTLCNYAVRAVRFHFYLQELKISINFSHSLYIFLSGLSMTVTPGKTGEIVKAYLLKKMKHTKFSEIVPVLIIERLTDGIAMIILALGGIFFVQNGRLFLLFTTLFVLAFIIFMKLQTFVISLIFNLEKRYPKFKLLEFFTVFFKNSQRLITIKALSVGIFFGIIAWAFEAFALYLLVTEFIPVRATYGILTSFFIFSFSSIAGFFVLIPGGIGVAEGSITYFLTSLFPLGLSQAIFITLLFRFITLWFGVTLGLSTLIWYMKKYVKA